MDDEAGEQGTGTTDVRPESAAGAARPRPGRRDDVSPEVAAEHLRERVYGTVAVLASLVTLADPSYDGTAGTAAVTVVVTVGSLWLASLFADVTAHLAVHGVRPSRALIAALVSTRSEILATAVVPLLLLAAAAARCGSWARRWRGPRPAR